MTNATNPWSWNPARPARIDQPVTLLRLEGPDSLRFLHGQSSQDLERARAGQWLGTCCIGPTARMLALAEVLVDADGAWLLISAGDGAAVRQALDRVLFPTERVELGPLLPALWIRPVPAADGNAGPGDRTWQLQDDGTGWWLGESLVLPAADPLSGEALAELPSRLAERQPLSAAEAERWRIGRGWPSAPAEINDDTNPFELGLADRVSLDKGCYVGQETLAKLATYDGVKQQLRRWWHPGDSPAEPLAAGTVLRGEAGERAGRITSTLRLGDGEGWIGLALVRRQALEAPQLRCGERGAEMALRISLPAEAAAPPVGAGKAQV